MKCMNPYYKHSHDIFFPCGKCKFCQSIRRSNWVTRMILEAKDYKEITFLTLTYSDEFLPKTEDGYPTLSGRDVTLFLKRFRKNLMIRRGIKIRYFYAAEYGSKFGRPHYHLIIYGIDYKLAKEIALLSWSLGFVKSYQAEEGSFYYVASYCSKQSDKQLHKTQMPEFFRSSIGLGRRIINQIVDAVKSYGLRDVPLFVYHGKRKMYLTRYWVKKIREICFPPSHISQLIEERLCRYREFFKEQLIEKGLLRLWNKGKAWKSISILYKKECWNLLYKPGIENWLARQKLFAKRGIL